MCDTQATIVSIFILDLNVIIICCLEGFVQVEVSIWSFLILLLYYPVFETCFETIRGRFHFLFKNVFKHDSLYMSSSYSS